MNTNPQPKRSKKGFTLIEMIGVLAVIAILAALLIPKIFEAINNSRISNAALTCNSVKTAIADHYAKFGSLLSSNGVPISAGVGVALAFDRVLVTEGFIDKPFAVKISSATNYVELQAVFGTNTPAATDNEFDLDGNGTSDTTGIVVEAVITGVVPADALALSRSLDGDLLSQPDATSADIKGRVKYDYTPGSTSTVRVYLTHR